MSIICEIGQNFSSDLNLAKKLILLAKDNGGDLAKFQLYDTDKLYTPDTELYRLAKESELTQEQAQMLFDYGESIGMEVFFSVFDIERVNWCEEIGVKRYKIASSVEDEDIFFAVYDTHKPVILSHHPFCFRKGGKPISVVGKYMMQDTPDETKLYCIPNYPTKLDELELYRLDNYDGFSDHTIGLDCAKIALARGAKIIEKHFCISHDVGVDAPWSMDANELRELVRWQNVVNQVL
uniref:Putative N-acetylneuraminate synthase n=1 Tax=viral metagenome TaxID=1070528 RepID=A0A6M3IK77_9ZZZZ